MFTVKAKLQQTPTSTEQSDSEDTFEQRNKITFVRSNSEPSLTKPDPVSSDSPKFQPSSLNPDLLPDSPYPPEITKFEVTSPTPTTYLKFEKHVVEHFSSLPTKVEEVLHTAEVYEGHLSWSTGYAAVVTLTYCYVWNYKKDHDKQPLKRPDTVYKFQMPICKDDEPSSNKSYDKLPLVCIIPSIQGANPGLMVCTPEGEFRYWEDISYAMTEANRYKSLQLHLRDNDRGIYLTCHEIKRSLRENWAIIFGTERAALYRINIFQSNGKPTLDYTLFPRPGGIMSQLSSYIWQSGNISGGDFGKIVSTTLGIKLGKNHFSGTYVLLEKSLEKWDLPLTRNHTPKYSSGYDIYKSIVQEIRYNDGGFEAEDREIKLLDLEYARNEELILLVSSVPNSNQMEFDETKNVSYFLIVLNIPELTSDNGQYNIVRCIPLKVQSNISLGPQAHLIMPNGGPATFVVFPQAIFLTTIIKGANYNNIVTMRDPINDRIIGFCAEGSKSWHFKDKDDNISQIHVLTTKTGVMSCQLNIAEIKEKSPQNKYDEMDIEDSQAKTNRELKSTLEQAVFRKGEQNVPVECTLSPDFKGDINQVVLEISDEILESRSKFMENLNDLSFQLNERNKRMSNLIKFINNSNIMDKLYYSTRQQIFWDSEKVACAKKLWEYYNMSYNSSRDTIEESLRKLMTNAIQDYIQDRNIKIKPLEDIPRYFFRYRVRDLGSVFTHIQRVIEILSDTEARSTTVLEANAIILLCFDAAFDFRRNNKELYAITTNDSKGSWTYQPELLKVLQRQFEETDVAIRNYTLQSSNKSLYSIDENDNVHSHSIKLEKLKDHLSGLADVLFKLTAQRLICDDIIEKNFAQNYRDQWTDILKKLVTNGMSDKAFDLSETYEDYKSLVSLIMESNLDVNKYIEIYMLKYKEKFAFMLYEWYFEKERYADLLSQQHATKHKEWLQKFLNERNLSGISWIHDINMRQYSDASIKTRHLAQKVKRIEDRKTFLSISKLTYLTELKDDSELKSDQVLETFDEIRKCGELVIAYKEIQDQFIKAATSSNQRFYNEYDQVNYIAKKVISNVQESRPLLAKLFIQCIPRILRGEKVSTEELVGVMTLRDVKQKDDYPFVLLFVSEDKLLPDALRRELLQTIWRRIYINDRWDWISDTNDMSDEEINERISDTAVFHTLLVAQDNEKPLSQWFNPPASSFFASTVEQLQSRFPTFKEEQIKELIEDYKKENIALQHAIQELQLNTHVDHALRLLKLKSLGDDDQLDPMEVEDT